MSGLCVGSTSKIKLVMSGILSYVPNSSLIVYGSTEKPLMKPLAYGYIRVTDDLTDDEVQQLEGKLRKLAEAEGFCLVEIRSEYQAAWYGTFYELIEDVKQAGMRPGPLQARIGSVVVPSLDHLSTHPRLREQLVRRLDEAGVRVWVVEPLFRSGLVSGG